MGRGSAGLRARHRGPSAATALLALALGLAGCGGGAASPAASPGSAGTLKQASGEHSRGPLARSPLRVLTTLDSTRLCAALSPAEATRILGAAARAPVYGKVAGLGIYCRWLRHGLPVTATGDELYVGISAVIGWAGTQQVDKLMRARPVRVDGHPALAAAAHGTVTWAQVDVALGGADDPVAEFRAPTLTMATELAAMATPHILAMG
jgi:hypothetical protein